MITGGPIIGNFWTLNLKFMRHGRKAQMTFSLNNMPYGLERGSRTSHPLCLVQWIMLHFSAGLRLLNSNMRPIPWPREKTFIFSAPMMSYWDRFANMLKRLKAHVKNGKENMAMQLSAKIAEKIEGGAK